MQTQQPFWRKKSFIIAFFLLALLVVATNFLLGQKQLLQKVPFVSYPTPTPVSLPQSTYANLTIITVPDDNSSENSLFATVSAMFSRPLTKLEQAYVTFSTNPRTTGRISWSSDNTTATYTPSVHFATDTTYEVTITFGTLIKSWSFRTVSNDNVSQEDQNNIQLQSDEQFGNWQNQLYSSYPWYDNLPLQTADYYTYFDTSTKQFISDLYVSSSDTQKVNALKQEILQQLQSFTIDTNQYKFIWNYAP